MKVPGTLRGAIRSSDNPRARVLAIDPSKALSLPGVMAVVTAADAPGRLYQGDIFPDWPQFVAVGEVTRYVGDVLAAVAAEERHTAREAAARIEIEYEVLDPVADPFEAMDSGAPILH